jgi:cytochrome c oxidase cbb3-type subunit 3
MKNIIIVAVLVSLVLLGVIYAYVGDIIGDDMVNILSMLAAVVILALSVGVGAKYVNQMKTDEATGELADENWDGIGEYKNELPIGWALSFLGTIVWGIWYFLAGYPLNAYSQLGEYADEVQEYKSKYESKWAGADKETLTDMGQSLYLVQCAPCHGETAEGMSGRAQDLTKWGHEEGIIDTVVNGSKGLNYPMGEMPAGMLDAESAKAVAAYIMAELSEVKKSKYPELVETGKSLFGVCAGCHGDDGKGMAGMAPDLTIYGTTTFVADVLDRGKTGSIGTMPSFKGRLSDIQYKAVGTYILSLGEE